MPRSRAALLAFSLLLHAACSGTVLGGGGRSSGDAAPGDPGGGGGDGGSGNGEEADGGLDPAALQAELQATVDRLQAEAAWRTPGSAVAIAVQHLPTGARASSRGGELYVSASSAKAWWVAAALDAAGITPVEPYADP